MASSVIDKKTLSQRDQDAMLAQAGPVTDLLKAMSHESRLLILCLLLDGEKSVSEIEETINLAQATVSQHLARLRLKNIIESRRDGRQIYYRLIDAKVATLMDTLHKLYCLPDET